MATRIKRMDSPQSLADMENGTDNRVAALIPVNARGETVNVDGDDWRMPVSSESDPNESTDEPPVQSPAERVIAMLADMGDDPRAYVKVSRIERGSIIVWCSNYSPADFEAGGLQLIRDQWGPGEYQIIVYGTLPDTKRFTVRTRANVRISPSNVVAGVQTVTVPQNDLTQVVQQMMQQQQEFMRVMMERPQVDPKKEMRDMLEMMTLMRTATGADQKPSGMSELGGMLKMMKQVQEMGEMFSPKQIPDTPMGMVSQMLPLLQTAMAQRQATPQQIASPKPQPIAAPPVAQLTAPVLSENPIPITPQSESQQNVSIIELKSQLALLQKMAVESAPIEDGAHLVYEKLPDEMLALLSEDDWFDNLKSVSGSDIEAQKDWYSEVRKTVLEWLAEDMAEVNAVAVPTANEIVS